MIDKEMLAAISDLLDQKLEEKLEEKLEKKLQPIYVRLDRLEDKTEKLSDELRYVKVVQLENNIIPRLNTIEACFMDAADRWIRRSDQIDTMQADVDNLKITVGKHSEKIQKLSRKSNRGLQKIQ